MMYAAFDPNLPSRSFEQKTEPPSNVVSARRMRLLVLPDCLDADALGMGAVQIARNERPDAVLLTQQNGARLIVDRLSAGPAAIVPVVDASLGSRHSGVAKHGLSDLQIAAADRQGIADALAMLAPMAERVRSLPESVLHSDDPRVILLARLMVRDRGMEPRRDPNTRDTVVYDDEAAVPGARRHAEDLVALGLLHPQFVDMLTICPRCESGRLCARERCSACGSTHLVEEPIFHHLRCAYQAPEHEFRAGSGFMCPKCRAQLVHFSVDYDRPGSVSVCRACGHASGETPVGLVCLDCGVESDAADAGAREIHRYELTKVAYQCVASGSPLPAHSRSRLGSAIDRIHNFVARRGDAGESFCILAAGIEMPLEKSAGRSHQLTCSLFASLMRETFTPDTEIIDAAPRFFALLADEEKCEVERALPEIRTRLEQFLSAAIAIRYRVYAPSEVGLIFGSTRPPR
jgi:Thaumarchaeal output domain 1